jgi:hypothetical protein
MTLLSRFVVRSRVDNLETNFSSLVRSWKYCYMMRCFESIKMINADFFRKSQEIFERVFAAVVAISGLAAAAVRNTSSILASDFTFLAISCALLGLASYIIRSGNQKVDSHFLPWVIIKIASAIICIFLSIVGFFFLPPEMMRRHSFV